MTQLIPLIQAKYTDYGRRVMTFEDLVAICTAERIVVDVSPTRIEGSFLRKPLAQMTLHSELSEKYRVFAGFHELAHVLGASRSHVCLDTLGWQEDPAELEASTVGYLALAPYRHGPPYPRLVKAHTETTQMEFWIEYPDDVLDLDDDARVKRKLRWRQRRTVLIRAGQTELPFGQGRLL